MYEKGRTKNCGRPIAPPCAGWRWWEIGFRFAKSLAKIDHRLLLLVWPGEERRSWVGPEAEERTGRTTGLGPCWRLQRRKPENRGGSGGKRIGAGVRYDSGRGDRRTKRERAAAAGRRSPKRRKRPGPEEGSWAARAAARCAAGGSGVRIRRGLTSERRTGPRRGGRAGFGRRRCKKKVCRSRGGWGLS